MTDIRIARAGPHALTLLTDIRDNAARNCELAAATWCRNSFDDLYEHATECSVHYFLGFADHHPFGYLRVSIDEGESEISGPLLYPEYQQAEYVTAFLNFAVLFLENQSTRLAYSLVPPAHANLFEGYVDALFEEISDNTEFIRRWHDGALADRQTTPGTRLFARLLEKVDSRADSN